MAPKEKSELIELDFIVMHNVLTIVGHCAADKTINPKGNKKHQGLSLFWEKGSNYIEIQIKDSDKVVVLDLGACESIGFTKK